MHLPRTAYAAAALALLTGLSRRADAAPSTFRIWSYASMTAMLSEHWGFVATPGVRVELSRSEASPKGHYLDELFLGPTYVHRWGGLSLKLSLLYHFTGYARGQASPYVWTHSLEFIPQVDYRWRFLQLTNRVILQNTFYATAYDTPEQRAGYALVLRELAQVTLWPHEEFGVILADEPFFGLVEDGQTTPSSAGFWPKGYRLNRVYAGFTWKVSPTFTVTPQYVFETVNGKDGSLQEMGHYLFTTFAWNVKAR